MALRSLRKARVIAHRGASAYAPENTLAAMRHAHDIGATWVEFDVMLAGCGKVIVFHDDNLERTTGVNRLVVDTPFDDMQYLNAGSWFDHKFEGEKIPTFRELLGCLQDLSMDINIEIKPTVGKTEETVDRMLDVLYDCWSWQKRPPLITSQDLECLRIVRQRAPQLDLGCVIHNWYENWHEWVQDLGCIACSVNQEILDPKSVEKVKEVVPLIIAYTVNDRSHAERLFDMGVDAVFSDHPDIMK